MVYVTASNQQIHNQMVKNKDFSLSQTVEEKNVKNGNLVCSRHLNNLDAAVTTTGAKTDQNNLKHKHIILEKTTMTTGVGFGWSFHSHKGLHSFGQ